VFSPSVGEHEEHLREVLRRMERAGFTFNPEKSILEASEIKYLRHLLSSQSVKLLPDRVEAIQRYPRQTNLRALRRFLGMVGFYTWFIPKYSRKAATLHALKRKDAPFVWDKEHQRAFDSLKRASCEAPVLKIPDIVRDFVLVTDASDPVISAVLHQMVNGALAPISYCNRLLTAAERKYSTYEKECFAVLFDCERCRSFVEHKEFELHCDNLTLCWLLRSQGRRPSS